MDEFDQFLDSQAITKRKVLDAIGDEWSAICYYLSEAYGIEDFEPELRKAYNSPIRYEKSDDKPSFSLFKNQLKGKSTAKFETDYIWKDAGLNKSGDLFRLVKEMYDLRNDDEVFRKIDADFSLELFNNESISSIHKTIRLVKPPIDKPPAFIQITTKPFSYSGLKFWAKYGITKEELEKEEVYEVKYFWTSKDQKTPFTPQSLCFAYLIRDEKGAPYYKLYQPYNKEFKFIQDYPDYFVEGWAQLGNRSSELLITKSKKDCIVLHFLGYEAVSPKSESTMIKDEQIQYLIKRFGHDNLFVLFDNDGKHNGDKYQEKYNFPLMFIPLESETKDISDFTEKYGKEKAVELIQQLIKETKDARRTKN